MHWLTHLEGGPKRVNHAAVAVGHKIYTFGGYCTGENSREYTSMDVHVLNTATFRWTKHPVSDLPYFENDDILPYKRYGHTAVVYGDKVYIWGGRNDRASCGTLFCFDTVWHCWTAPPTDGSIPFPRDGHTACVWQNQMLVFGGYEEETDAFAESVFALNLDTMSWSFIKCGSYNDDREQEQPAYRDFHTAVCINDRMYLFGGRGNSTDGEFYPNSIWYLDLQTLKWHCPIVSGDIPVGRRSHSAFVYNNKMYIFGGYNSIEGRHYNDMYEFDPESNIWKLIEAHGKKPCERRRQACVIVNDRVFLFGGTSPRLLPPYYNNTSHRLNFLIMENNTTSNASNNTSDDQLIDHCDMHILDFKPSLKTLAMLAVRQHKVDESPLPKCLKMDIMNMFTPNKITISRPNNSAG